MEQNILVGIGNLVGEGEDLLVVVENILEGIFDGDVGMMDVGMVDVGMMGFDIGFDSRLGMLFDFGQSAFVIKLNIMNNTV